MDERVQTISFFVHLLLDLVDEENQEPDRLWSSRLVANLFTEEIEQLKFLSCQKPSFNLNLSFVCRELASKREAVQTKEDELKAAHIALLMETNMYKRQLILWKEKGGF